MATMYPFGSGRGANQNYGLNNTTVGNDPNWFRSAGSVGHWNYEPQEEETIVEDVVYPNAGQTFPLDPNWQHQLRMQNIDRGNINNKWYDRITTPVMGIMRAVGDKFKRSPEKQAFYDAVVGEQSLRPGQWTRGDYGGNQYEVYQSPTGLKVGSDIIGWGEGYEKNLDSMFGSKSIEEMEDKKIDWAMNRINKGKAISQRLRTALTDRGLIGGDQRGDQRGDNNWITSRNTGNYNYGGTKTYGPFTPQRTNVPTHIGPTGQSLHGGYRSDRPDKSGSPDRGFTNPGRGSYGPHRAEGGRMASGGRVGLRMGGDPTQWMETQETISPFQIQQEEGVPMGLMASNPDPMAELNEFSLQIFKKPFDQLNDSERDILFEMMNDQAFGPEPRPVGDPYGTPQGEEIVEEGIARLV